MEFVHGERPAFTLCFRRHSLNKGDTLTPEGVKLAFEQGKREGMEIDRLAREFGVDYVPVWHYFSETKRARDSALHHMSGVSDSSRNAFIKSQLDGSQTQDKRLNTFNREAMEKTKGRPLDNEELNGVVKQWAEANDKLEETERAGFEHRGVVQRRFNKVLAEGLKMAKLHSNSGYVRAYRFSHSGMPTEGSERGVLDAVFEMLSGEKVGRKSDAQLLTEAKTGKKSKEIPSFKHLEGFNVHFLKRKGKWGYVVEEVRRG